MSAPEPNRTHDLELGVAAVHHHVMHTVIGSRRISQRRLDFERSRPRWLRECIAEATGVFMYVLPGIGATASFTLNAESPIGSTAFGSLFSIGFAFAFGIAFAIIICAPVSGGHFNPAVTISATIWLGFPLKKVPHYILSQLLGGFIAALVLMGIYHQQINEMKETLLAAGHPLVANGAPASLLCSFPNPDQSMGYVFLAEFFASSFVALLIWACIDPANPLVSPYITPLVIGFAYASMAWAFGSATVNMNAARDLGPRIVAAIFYGGEAFTYKNYAPIAILVNIPATFIASSFYELVIRDSLLVIKTGHAVHADGDEALMRHITDTMSVEGIEETAAVLKTILDKPDLKLQIGRFTMSTLITDADQDAGSSQTTV
ncbi:aquaporin-like protein [Trichoderma cornu-damae]|uniref:Aquaporin-like protein n=1 Tax=Trichoderma cornu-damae TaxID=654480 RepID=A0A9P8QKU0_9HYPO|nr:aquaporin-like protein [Trichoderma cornu-damae]